jgi:hypothetical protein
VLRRARARHGDVFTLRLATVRPLVVVARVDEVEALLTADPRAARAGEARGTVLVPHRGGLVRAEPLIG